MPSDSTLDLLNPPAAGGANDPSATLSFAEPVVHGPTQPLPSRAFSRPPPAEARSTVLPRLIQRPEGPALETQSRPRYQTRALLGQGGVGEVEAVLDDDIGREVAIKRLKPDMRTVSGLLRFTEEVRTVGRLEHPNIVPLHDVGVDEQGRYYFVMKKVQGETLEAVLRRLVAGDAEAHARYPFEARVAVFRKVLDAVAFAHGHGILHRDLKPANIMIGHQGEVVVLDWGLARPVGAPPEVVDEGPPLPAETTRTFETQAGSVVGTPMYMSPEQARGEPLDYRSDIYALCVLFDEFLQLEHYLAGVGAAELDQVLKAVVEQTPPLFRPKRAQQPVIPMDLVWFCRKGLQKDPARRFRTVEEMIRRLDDRAVGLVPVQCHVTFTQRLLGRTRYHLERHPVLTAAAYGIALALSGAGLASLVLR